MKNENIKKAIKFDLKLIIFYFVDLKTSCFSTTVLSTANTSKIRQY